MPQYKLTYFDIRGVAELIRYIFAYGNQPYEDVRLPTGSLTDEKKKELGLPWGQVPILEIDGVIYSQSAAIARYLGRKFKLVGANELEELKNDEIIDAFKDYQNKVAVVFPYLRDPNSDQVKKAELIKNIVEKDTPVHLERFEKYLQANKSGWFIGNGITLADITVAYGLSATENFLQIELVKNYPALQKLIQKVENSPGIKEWIAKRPQTMF